VTPRELKAKIDDKTFVYGNPISFSITLDEGYAYAAGDNINSLQVNYTGYDKYVTVEPYVVEAVATSPNYIVEFTAGSLTITKRDITINVSDIIITYGDVKTFEKNLPAGQTLSYLDQIYMLNINIEADEQNVGNYEALLTYNNDNYNVEFTGGHYTINKKPLEIRIRDEAIIYGETPEFSSSLWNCTMAYDDTLEDLNISYTPESQNAGERYSIGATCSNPNYNVIFSGGRLDIAKRPVTVIIDDVTLTYGNNPEFSYRLQNGSTLASWDSIQSLNVECSSEGVNVIDTPLPIVSSYDNDNYTVTFITGYHRITPRNITLKVKNVIKEYGEAKEFSGNDVEITEGSMAFGESLASLNLTFAIYNTSTEETIENNLNINRGTYGLTAACSNTNYNVTIEDGNLTVKKRKVRITVEDIKKAYGDRDKDIPYTTSVSGLAFTGQLGREEGEAPGVYEINLGTLNAGDNYELVLDAGDYIIDGSLPGIAYAGLGFLGLSVIGAIFLIIRKFLGAKIL